MKKKTAIAISGGIDSLMAAYFLKEKGDEVFGIHFITGYESLPDALSVNSQDSHEKSISAISEHAIGNEGNQRSKYQAKVGKYETHGLIGLIFVIRFCYRGTHSVAGTTNVPQ